VVEVDAEGRTRMLRESRWVDVEGPAGPTEVAVLAGARSLVEGSACGSTATARSTSSSTRAGSAASRRR